MLANTYHLLLRPGTDLIEAAGGIHAFAAWDGHVLTDSGGYQAHSLPSSVDDGGVTIRSVYDGGLVYLTPESVVAAQEAIGADVQMVLDVCAPYPAGAEELRSALQRTAAWAKRSVAAKRREGQALFGIVQGGVDPGLRRLSAELTVALDFDGYGIGGLSVGEPRGAMLQALESAIGVLPQDRARYLMGVGDPVGLVEGVARGVDLFDCVAPTRLARHGAVLTARGRYNLRRAEHAGSLEPLEEGCPCATCSRYTRAYIRHLLMVGEPVALRLVTWHNVSWMLSLMDRINAAIGAGRLDSLRAEIMAAWG